MIEDRADYQKLLAATQALGAKICLGPDEPDDYSCPFNVSLALRFPDTLVLDPEYNLDSETIGESIHELGHLICARNTSSAEFDFLGWEFVVAAKFDLLEEWLEGMEDYSLGGSWPDFAALTPEEASDLLEERCYRAEQLGYLVDGEPQGLKTV